MQLNIKNLTNLLIFIVLILAGWFTAYVINPQLHYFLQQSAFLTNSTFFESFTKYPGGIADYVSEFISQFFYYRIAGSFLIILVAALLGFIAIRLIERLSGSRKYNFMVFGLLLMLSVVLQCNYYYPFYANIRLLITVAFIWLFSIMLSKYSHLRYYIICILAILLFYLAGGASLITFAIAAILLQIHLCGKKTDVLALPLFAIFCIGLPYLAYKYLFLVNLPLMYSITHSKSPEILYYVPDYRLYALYALMPASILMIVLSKKLQIRSEKAITQTKPKKSDALKAGKKIIKKTENKENIKIQPTKQRSLDSSIPLLAGQLAVIAILSVLLINYTFDKSTRNKILVSFYAANEDWQNVIKTTKTIEQYDIFVNAEYNRALANTGTLADNLFTYTQAAGQYGLFIDGKVTSDIPFFCCDQYYDLGFMNESQHWAFEAQTIFPNSPRLLKRLVQINLVNGKYELAEKFIRMLDDNMLYQDWVDRYQKYIDDTTLVGKDPEFSWKRKCEPTENFTASNPFLKLKKLVEVNPENKLAFDYLLCALLLDGDLVNFKDMISNNPIYTKSPLPRAWDEALVLYYYSTRSVPLSNDFQYTKKSEQNFTSFTKAVKPYINDWQQIRTVLQRDYGTTYWYYLKCLNPKITKVEIKRQ